MQIPYGTFIALMWVAFGDTDLWQQFVDNFPHPDTTGSSAQST
jgi:hypothetical protein